MKCPGGDREAGEQEQSARQEPSERESERELVAEAVRRNQGAFARLYDKHVVRVYRHVYYLVNDPREAEDLTAQTFLKAWEAIDRYKERGAPFVAWLLRIAHNVAISYLRSRREHSELDEGQVEHRRTGNPEEMLEQATDERSVRAAVLKLREEQRQVIMLRFVEEMDYRDVAAAIGKSVPAVRVIQHRALGNLRRLMGA